jgi:hypothetical protein
MSTNVKPITMKAQSAADVSKHIAGKHDIYYATVRKGYYQQSKNEEQHYHRGLPS